MVPPNAAVFLFRLYTGIGFTVGFYFRALINNVFQNETEADSNTLANIQSNKETCKNKENSSSDDSYDIAVSSDFRPAFLSILNQCDPVTFTHFSMTCHEIRDICLNSEGIQIKFPCQVSAKNCSESRGKVRFKYFKDNEGKRTVYGRHLENLMKMPFIFDANIKFNFMGVEKFNVDDEVLRENCWPALISLIKEHNVKELNIRDYLIKKDNLENLMSLKFDILNLNMPLSSGINLWKIGSKELSVLRHSSYLTSEQFTDFLQHLSDVGHLEFWKLRFPDRNFREVNFETYFNEFEMIDFEESETTPTTRPLACVESPHVCFVLTQENRVLRFEDDGSIVYIMRVRSNGSSPKAFEHFI